MKQFFLLAMFVLSFGMFAQTPCSDVLSFGRNSDESKHALTETFSQTYTGGLNQTARKMLPYKEQTFEGGTLKFNMKVNPAQQNYFTVRCWGDETDLNYVMLFIEGKQVGYRHLGDIDFLWMGNGEKPTPGRFFYITLPLPLKNTQGKKTVRLELRSYGPIWGYGENFKQYQKPMTQPTIGFYKAFTHTETCFVPAKNEVQGFSPIASKRSSPGPEVMDELKMRVNSELTKLIEAKRPLKQLEMWFLGDAWQVDWTVAYHQQAVVEKVATGIDSFYLSYLKNPKIIYSDPSVYNYEWLVTGPIARAIRYMWKPLSSKLDETILLPNGKKVIRREAWSEILQQSIQYAKTHRRQYTNQSMIIDMFLYNCNTALQLVDPQHSLPQFQTLKYLYESMGIVPWTGIETPKGPSMSMGENYYQLTTKGLTKELGFVGYYGEVLDWVVDIYRSTCVPGFPETGDALIRQQIIKIAKARSYFRYPAIDNEGFQAMRAEAVVGWRDAGHYPGNVIYGDRGTAWDATPLMTAYNMQDPYTTGFALQMFDENQFFSSIHEKMGQKGIRADKSLLHVPEEYEWMKQQKDNGLRLPMTPGQPDFVFSCEEDGVLAVKNGSEYLYASLYWRARNAVNKLAKVHYITPTMDRIANIYIDSRFTPQGATYTRPDWVNLGFQGNREWYPGLHSAHAGDTLTIAKIPEGVRYKVGDENVYAGRAEFYTMNYGKYWVAMNCTTDKTFSYSAPASSSTNLVNGQAVAPKQVLEVAPRTTVVLYQP